MHLCQRQKTLSASHQAEQFVEVTVPNTAPCFFTVLFVQKINQIEQDTPNPFSCKIFDKEGVGILVLMNINS